MKSFCFSLLKAFTGKHLTSVAVLCGHQVLQGLPIYELNMEAFWPDNSTVAYFIQCLLVRFGYLSVFTTLSWQKAFNYFCKKAPLQRFGMVLDTPLYPLGLHGWILMIISGPPHSLSYWTCKIFQKKSNFKAVWSNLI